MIFIENTSRMNHQNVKLTIDIYPIKFWNTEIMIKNGFIETSVAEYKIPNDLSLAVLKRYKQNAVLGDLHRVNKISSKSEFENSV